MVQSPVEIALIILMGIIWIGFFVNRHHRESDVTFNKNATRFAAIALIVPFVALLGFEGQLHSSATATVFGAIVGYLLSGFNVEPEKSAE